MRTPASERGAGGGALCSSCSLGDVCFGLLVPVSDLISDFGIHSDSSRFAAMHTNGDSESVLNVRSQHSRKTAVGASEKRIAALSGRAASVCRCFQAVVNIPLCTVLKYSIKKGAWEVVVATCELATRYLPH